MTYSKITAHIWDPTPDEEWWWDLDYPTSPPPGAQEVFTIWVMGPRYSGPVPVRITALVNLVYFGHPPYDD